MFLLIPSFFPPTPDRYREFSMGLWVHNEAGLMKGAWLLNHCLEERRASYRSEMSIWTSHEWMINFCFAKSLIFGHLSVIAACITLTSIPGKFLHLSHLLPSFGFWYLFPWLKSWRHTSLPLLTCQDHRNQKLYNAGPWSDYLCESSLAPSFIACAVTMWCNFV